VAWTLIWSRQFLIDAVLPRLTGYWATWIISCVQKYCDLLIHLNDACDYLAHALAQPPHIKADGSVIEPAVLVHCFKGVSRPALIIIASIMHKRKLFYKKEMPIVKKGWSCIWLKAEFAEQLDTWAYLDYGFQDCDERGLVIDTKMLYHKTRARWETVEKRRAAEKARG
jgi:hypothetical protein